MGNWLQDTYFQAFARKYTLLDLNNLLFITGCEDGKCAAPLGLYVCKCMELWGYLIAETEYSTNDNATEKIMDYLVMTLGSGEAMLIAPAIEFCNVPYALLGAGGHNITVAEVHPLFEGKTLNTKELAGVFMRSLTNLYGVLGDKAVAARAQRRLKALKEG